MDDIEIYYSAVIHFEGKIVIFFFEKILATIAREVLITDSDCNDLDMLVLENMGDNYIHLILHEVMVVVMVVVVVYVEVLVLVVVVVLLVVLVVVVFVMEVVVFVIIEK